MKMRNSCTLLVLLFLARLVSGQSVQAHIANFDDDRAAAISYTFDDNLRDQYTLAVPMLNAVGFKGTFFVIPGSTVDTVEEAEKKQDLARAWGGITWSELKEISSQGHEIASHTWSHPNLLKMSPEDIEAQFSKSYDAINTHIGKPPLTLAFPFNASTPEIQAIALKYYVAYRAYQIGTSDKSTVAFLNTWADSLVADHKWGIVMTHAVGKGYAALSDPNILSTHFKYVKSREADIWVDTFANVARYEKERDNVKLNLSEKDQTITCVLSSTLDPQRYDVPLTVMINTAGAHTVQAERNGKQLPVRVQNGSIYLKAAPAPEPITVVWK
jgi:peptidoglycan/xylan/chitin deacetylase (PgdA/CDA1 family)